MSLACLKPGDFVVVPGALGPEECVVVDGPWAGGGAKGVPDGPYVRVRPAAGGLASSVRLADLCFVRTAEERVALLLIGAPARIPRSDTVDMAFLSRPLRDAVDLSFLRA